MTYRRLTTIALIFTLFNAFFASQLSSASSLDDLLNNSASGSSSISSNANTLSTLKDLEQEFSLDDVATDEVFLRVEEAYKLTVSKLSDNNGLELSWLIADKYYLYGEQFKVSINNQAIAVNLPTGIIEYDQIFEKDVEKHYRQAKISIDQDQLPNHPGYELTVVSQGCADAGLCYPPQTERFSIDSDGVSPVIIDPKSNQLSNKIVTAAVDGEVNGANSSISTILYMIAFAIIGGAILNLMPCVLPVLSLKALALANSNANHRIQGWSYTLGAISTFVAIAALLLAIRAAGQAVGWGFQLQSPGFVTVLFYLFFVMGLSLSGFITLGARWMSAGQGLTQGSGLSQSYFTGVLAAVVASPCTAPFMAPALGFAITQPWSIALLIFASLGFGMALPLLLLSYIPSLNKLLPKPGAWMETFKQALAFPLYITAIWLLWVLSRQLGPNITALVIFGGLAIIFIYWLGQKSTRFLPATGAATIAVIAALSLHASQQEPLRASTSTANDSTWETYDEKRLASLRDAGKAVFINLTADWCITCLANEKVVFTESTLAAMKAKDITLLKGDWTNYDPQITKLLEKHKRGGVPLYLLFPAEAGKAPIVLPQILTPSGFNNALNKI
jgi:thiol:disulfide interchange protein DsbD